MGLHNSMQLLHWWNLWPTLLRPRSLPRQMLNHFMDCLCQSKAPEVVHRWHCAAEAPPLSIGQQKRLCGTSVIYKWLPSLSYGPTWIMQAFKHCKSVNCGSTIHQYPKYCIMMCWMSEWCCYNPDWENVFHTTSLGK